MYGIIRKNEGEPFIFKRGDFSNIIQTPFGNVAIDYFCKAYQNAFSVPVVYANSKGRLDYMMTNAGFHLNGMSTIYDNKHIVRSVGSCEISNVMLNELDKELNREDWTL